MIKFRIQGFFFAVIMHCCLAAAASEHSSPDQQTDGPTASPAVETVRDIPGESDVTTDEWGDADSGPELGDESEPAGDGGFVPATLVPASSDGTLIVGDRRSRRRISGSAHVVGEEELERLEYDDAHQVLRRIPGVYLRDEEGFGLRPNIGLRGANSDRSSKVTLLEDGVPLAPAPYSAPAAYYFPLTTRLIGLEVFKGPASVRHGPQTIGGAVNLRTRRVPLRKDAVVDLGGGAYGGSKAHAYVGFGDERSGVLLEGIHLRSDGFKELDGGGPTGFLRNDLMWKGRISSDPVRELRHSFELKLGYGDEVSHETYLGLTDADFRQNPYRRYRATALDLMQWHRTQIVARYGLELSWFDLQVVAYRHDLERAWRKLNRFRGGPGLERLLKNPESAQSDVFMGVLRGQDSATPEEALLIGTNDRRFYSQGIEARAHLEVPMGPLEHQLEVGARLHADAVDRRHTEDAYRMQGGTLVPEGTETNVLIDGIASAVAGAVYVADELKWGQVLVTPGLRLELIRTATEEAGGQESSQSWQGAWLPGLGVSWQPASFLALLGGVHKGFSPVSPGQSSAVAPEEAWSFESGARFFHGDSEGELVGFASRYGNITGECTLSSGCEATDLYQQFNGGAALVYGLETMARHSTRFANLEWDLQLTYTLTITEFLTTFESTSPLFGSVDAGDALPYVPTHQGSATLGARYGDFDIAWVTSYVGQMRDLPGQGEILEGEGTDDAWLVDATLGYRVSTRGRLYFRADNLFGQEYVSSLRPFGARPGKPRTYFIGYKHDFFD